MEDDGVTLFELQNFWLNIAAQKTAQGALDVAAADHADGLVDRFAAKFPGKFPVVDENLDGGV